MYGDIYIYIFFIVDVSYFYQGGKFPFISKKYKFSQRTKNIMLCIYQWKVAINFTESVKISRKSIILRALPAEGYYWMFKWNQQNYAKKSWCLVLSMGPSSSLYLYDSGNLLSWSLPRKIYQVNFKLMFLMLNLNQLTNSSDPSWKHIKNEIL